MTNIELSFQTEMSYTEAERTALVQAFIDFMVEFGDDEVDTDSVKAIEVADEPEVEKKYTVEEIREIMRTGAKDVKVSLFIDDEEFVIQLAEAAEDDEIDGE
jgi:hypothetical protein